MPNLVVVRENARYEGGILVEPPELVVEVVSPGQTLDDLIAKCQMFARFGVRHGWAIWPERRQAAMIASDASVVRADDPRDVLRTSTAPQVALSLSGLFAQLPVL